MKKVVWSWTISMLESQLLFFKSSLLILQINRICLIYFYPWLCRILTADGQTQVFVNQVRIKLCTSKSCNWRRGKIPKKLWWSVKKRNKIPNKNWNKIRQMHIHLYYQPPTTHWGGEHFLGCLYTLIQTATYTREHFKLTIQLQNVLLSAHAHNRNHTWFGAIAELVVEDEKTKPHSGF